jgi:hypothetical protein
MKAMSAFVKVVRVSGMLGLVWASFANAALFRIVAEVPPIVSDVFEAIPLAPLELGTKVSSVDRVSMHVAGIHTNGWWDGWFGGDGPIGARLDLYLFTGRDIHIPGPGGAAWYEGIVTLTNDGAFTVSAALVPAPPWLSIVPYVPEGETALCCVVWPVSGVGTVVRQPFLELSQVQIELEAQPVLRITSVSADGLLSWSALPSGGVIELLAATDVNGPWEVEVRLPSESRSTRLQGPQATTRRFYRLRWQEGGPP